MLVLGSSSPRRREILSYFRIPFEVQPSEYDESLVSTNCAPDVYVTTLARKKALALPLQKNAVLLTADTAVVLGAHILGKPSSLDHAVDMLLSLSGTTHEVVTGVCVRTKDELYVEHATTNVVFTTVTKEAARQYAEHFAVLDKAGAYAIQHGGGIITEKIDGCFYNVMGLPLQLTAQLLRKGGIDLWDALGTH